MGIVYLRTDVLFWCPEQHTPARPGPVSFLLFAKLNLVSKKLHSSTWTQFKNCIQILLLYGIISVYSMIKIMTLFIKKTLI